MIDFKSLRYHFRINIEAEKMNLVLIFVYLTSTVQQCWLISDFTNFGVLMFLSLTELTPLLQHLIT